MALERRAKKPIGTKQFARNAAHASYSTLLKAPKIPPGIPKKGGLRPREVPIAKAHSRGSYQFKRQSNGEMN